MNAVTSVQLNIPKFRSGKVREVFDLGEHLLMVATDRVSAFDVVMPNGIPDKGKILNQLSLFWFKQFEDVISHHVVTAGDNEISDLLANDYDPILAGRSTVVKKCEPVLIESVARAYLAGSLHKEYAKSGGREKPVELHGIELPAGIPLCGQLPETIYTPATKAQEGHDENISFSQAAAIAGKKVAAACRDATLRIFDRASAICARADIILADSKFEFGIHNGQLMLIDEVLTPDSSRFWPKASYRAGEPQDSLDKQFIRDYLETLDWNKTAPGPQLPERIIEETRTRYIDIFNRISGKPPSL